MINLTENQVTKLLEGIAAWRGIKDFDSWRSNLGQEELDYYKSQYMEQQGDVMLKATAGLEKGAKKLNTKVLQLGEVTGHKHQFLSGAEVEVYVDKAFAGQENSITPDEGKFIIVGDTVQLFHEEHKPVTVEPGIYQVDIVREFDYDKMEATRVQD